VNYDSIEAVRIDGLLKRRTRLFALPIGGDTYYEFDARSMSSGYAEGYVRLEVSVSDRKIVKKWHKARVMLKFGIMFPDGTRITFPGYIASRQKNQLTIEVDVFLAGDAEHLGPAK
jgi:hypothetical protein